VFATDWENLTVAGAFVLGAVLGALGAIRVMRAVFGYARPNLFRGAQKPPPSDEGGG
jgi:hypothetical protein